MTNSSSYQFAVSGVEITQEVAKFGDTYYPIINIGAVSVTKKKIGYRMAGFFYIVISMIAAAITHSLWWLVLTVIGFFMIIKRPNFEYTLSLATSSGNKQAFKTRDKDKFDQVRNALEAAISARKIA